MRISRLFCAISLAVALGLCKPACAGENQGGWLDGFTVGGYSSQTLNVHPGGDTEAGINDLSLLIGWDGGGRFRFFSELELEHPLSWNSGEGFNTHDSELELERFYFDYNLNEKLNLRAGRFLTPAGRWNLIHAAPLVWTATRPLATSRLFPQFTNGVMLYGAKPFGDKAFEYTFFMEGLQDQHLNPDEIKYKDSRGARFTFTSKVNLGLSLLEFTEDIPGTPRYRMVGLDFLVKHRGWEFSGEGFQRYATNNSDGGSGAYLQAVAPLGHDWYGTARIENFNRPAEGSAERWLLGTAWKMAPNRILKIEYVGGDDERADAPKGFFTSFAILF